MTSQDVEARAEVGVRRVVELRIHGVGGETPYTTLGVGDDHDALDPCMGREKSGFYARLPSDDRRDPEGVTVRAYNWARLTSRSTFAWLWPLLLPFTLLNIAGFMHRKPRDDVREKAIRYLIRYLGYVTTAAWGTWIAGLVLDTPGGMALRAGVVAAVFAALFLVARHTGREFEKKRPPERMVSAGRDHGVSLHDANMWSWAEWHSGQHLVHSAIGLLPALLLIAGERSLLPFGFSDLLVFVVFLQGGLLLVLAGFSIADGYVGRNRRGSGPFTAAAVGVGMGHGYLSVLGWALDRWGLSTLPAFGQRLFETAGYGAAATVAAFLVVVLVVVVPGFFRPPVRPEDAAWVEGGVTPRRTALAQHSARLLRNMGWVLTPPAIAFSLVLLALLGGHLAPTWPLPGERVFVAAAGWLERDGVVQGVARAAAAATPLGVAALCAAMLGSLRSDALRRLMAIPWDVLTFWPRWHHPFAVRSYAERAVPELQAQLLEDLDTSDRVIVSAHSQGAVLAYAAVAPMEHLPDASRICMVTFGAPLSTLHARFFPGWVDAARQRRLHHRLGAWRNCYRLTDYIGQIVEGLPDEDNVECPEPPVRDDLFEGPRWADEMPARVTTSRLLRHSGYRAEPALREVVTAWLTRVETTVRS